MPGILDSPATPVAPQVPALAPTDDFEVIRQRVWLDINPLSVSRSITGRTEITVVPRNLESKILKLNSRQARITKLSNSLGKAPSLNYKAPYQKATLPGITTASQWEQLNERIKDQLEPIPEPELLINFGKVNYDFQEDEGILLFEPVVVYMEFQIENVREGLQFVGCNPEDMRYPHVYTHAFAGSAASCLFPCVDNASTRYEWEIAIKTPKTLGDAVTTSGRSEAVGRRFSEEDKTRDIIVVCSGELTDEIADKHDSHKKETSFRIEPAVLAQHVGFAIGPFEQVNLSAFRESGEDDKLGKSAIQLHGFCLPGRTEELGNTCFPLAKAIDNYVQSYGAYPFKSYLITFVDDMLDQGRNFASLSLCSTRLLFSEEILEPLNRVTRYLAFCVASQWFGINIVPAQPKDTWVIMGAAYFMADSFMKKLAGSNEYRYFQKRQADRVFESDIRRPSLRDTGMNLWLDPSQAEFLALKGSMVMFILDRRLVKANGNSGLGRIIFKLCLLHSSGDLYDGFLDTDRFMRICEKNGHIKLDSFFSQWVEGAGCPHFQVTQRFNKKRLVVEMSIKQVQHEAPEDPTLKPDEFLRDVREEAREVWAGETQHCFRGPMTIRIHEADGTPYEHIVEIKDMITRIEIPYNTKYKRIKRTRRNKEKLAQGSGRAEEDAQSGVYMLGDNLSSGEDIEAWRLEEWTPEEEDRMNSESFEWIRMDADFEWICRMQFNMPPHMYLSQLQQDKDVVAQIESLTYFANHKESKMVSTFLVRTLMDRRYFYGIRSAAATALSKHAKDEVDWVGLYHLKKAFQTLFCLPNGMIRPNDFSDRALHYIQCAIVRSMGMIRDNSGRAPYDVRRFLYETLRYNDNSNNEYSDAHFLQAVMRALGSAAASAPPLDIDPMERNLENLDDIAFFRGCLEEVNRKMRLDEWMSSYNNILTIEGLNAKFDLMGADRIQRDPREFLRYTQVTSHDDVRIDAFRHLLDLGFGSNAKIIAWFLLNMGSDSSAYVRRRLLELFCRWLGMVATGQLSLKESKNEAISDALVVETDTVEASREAEVQRRTTVNGAIAALKADLGNDKRFKANLWSAALSPVITIFEIGILLDICNWLYDPESRLVVALKYPRYWEVLSDGPKALANGSQSLILRFSKTDRVRTKPVARWEASVNDSITLAPKGSLKRKSSTFQPDTSMAAPKTKIQKRSSMPNGMSASPPPSATEAKKSLKLKLKLPGHGSPTPQPGAQTPGAQTPGGSIKLKLKLPTSSSGR